ncbi:SAM-dependent methyltransferase [Desulfobacca acetoxidans]|uniref:Uroporphyrin-III C/tetrapyrrole (Corrin/Porphyrin) methyltransferase n=1 Tax=Desulfobacca acetoxidans (strain ATCC 700848 / DSM 11109 / ASRB2) TaxID=880072 RepID=F2NHH4_DESAR|nr:SAM-dependent methyltransferase [Desulfobacca acetoxidans]AEB09090.1 Uroporphyrin-III C/tetrapyrrole (Corrin/Porphyrin) methyltransferase [Desulfobacca acetoxidans DSM 11109]
MMIKEKLLLMFLTGCLCLAWGTISGVAAPSAPGKFYLVGTGPAGPEHATLKAMDTINKADLILCHPELQKLFQSCLNGKKVEDPWKELWWHQGKMWIMLLPNLPLEERRALVEEKMRQRDKFVQRVKGLLDQGQKVVLLDGGDPTVYSRAYWLMEGLNDDRVEIIPGVGALSACMAALKRPSTGGEARFMSQTAGYCFFGKPDRDDLARDFARISGTLVVYSGLKEANDIFTTLKKYNPEDLPAAVVYFAGFPDKEKIVKGTMKNIREKIAAQKEEFMGLIIVGRCLDGARFPRSVLNLPERSSGEKPSKGQP